MFRGYWGKPEETLEAFRNLRHHTGDLGYLDADGLLHFVDRKKDSLPRRGENISSVELEGALAQFPGVREVAVHAVPSPLGEDDIKACLVLDGEPPRPTTCSTSSNSTCPTTPSHAMWNTWTGCPATRSVAS